MFPIEIIQSPNNIIVGHNIKFDIKKLEQHYKVKHQCKLFDTLIMYSLIDENSTDNQLKQLASIYTGLGHYEDNIDVKNLINEPLEKVLVYNCLDSITPLKLFEVFYPILEKQGLLNIFNFVTEMLSIFVEIEQTGVYINQAKMLALLQKHTTIVNQITNKYTGVNLNSHKQLSEILFKKLQLPVLTYTKGKKPSTDKDTINELNALPDLTDIQKLVLKDLKTLRDSTKDTEHLTNIATNLYDGRIHTTYNLGKGYDESGTMRGTVTGRLSSNNPNLQNIPTDSEIRQIFEHTPNTYNYWVSADYSQIELRVAAFLSREPNLINAFKENKDAHTAMLCKIHNEDYDKVNNILTTKMPEDLYKKWYEHRLVIKRVNFGILYQIGTEHLVKIIRQMGISLLPEQVKEIIEQWYKTNSVLRKWITELENTIIRQGFYKTIFGRVRHLQGANRTNELGQRKLRQGINFPIQSAASDICLLGIYHLYHTFKKTNQIQSEDYYRLLMTVHDEISFETKETNKEIITEGVKMCMEQFVLKSMKDRFGIDFDIPLTVDVNIANCWKK